MTDQPKDQALPVTTRAGSAEADHDREIPQVDLLSPLTIRGVTFRIEQSVELAKRLKELGVDLIDVSSGGMVPEARIPVAKGYQVAFARRIREEADIRTGAVGLITDPHHADEIITSGDANLVFLARELLREPYWALKAEHTLGEEADWPIAYGYAIKRRPK